jgi:hypothetical protein
MDILHNTLEINTNRCICEKNKNQKTLKSDSILIFLCSDYYNEWVGITKRNNLLYFATNEDYVDIYCYLIYLILDEYVHNLSLSKYLIYLSYNGSFVNNTYTPHIVYLWFTVEDFDSISYKNLQYFAYDVYHPNETHLYINKSYLTIAIFHAGVETFTSDSVYLRQVNKI